MKKYVKCSTQPNEFEITIDFPSYMFSENPYSKQFGELASKYLQPYEDEINNQLDVYVKYPQNSQQNFVIIDNMGECPPIEIPFKAWRDQQQWMAGKTSVGDSGMYKALYRGYIEHLIRKNWTDEITF